jgi:D-sedoheptulose 7-phosphate isomerase
VSRESPAMIAKVKQMNPVWLIGKTGRNLAEHCNICIKVPESEIFQIQELYLPIYHIFWGTFEQISFG